jgi:phosphatidylglycerol lysyltransferase
MRSRAWNVLALLLLAGLVAGGLAHHASAADPARIAAAFAAIGPADWAVAAALTALSLAAASRYDAAVARAMGLPVAPSDARRAGFAAIAVAQAAGAGPVAGALVRWRILPGLGARGALSLSLGVSGAFFAAWAVLAAVAFAPARLAPPVAGLALIAIGVILAAAWRIARRRAPRWAAAGLRILPLAAIDLGAAAGAFHALVPTGTGPGFAELLPAFLLALALGLVLATPAGIGPFDLALVALLPAYPAEPLIAAALAYRVVHVALPALIGAGIVVAGPSRRRRTSGRFRPPDEAGTALSAVLSAARGAGRSEALLLRQGLHGTVAIGAADASKGTGAVPEAGAGGHMLAATSLGALVALGAPFGGPSAGRRRPLSRDAAARCAAAVRDAAHGAGLAPIFYKAPARLAAGVRRRGFRVALVSREAVIDPRRFSTATPSRAGLRRKLGRAARAGIAVEECAAPPMADLARIHGEWLLRNGRERGFSMGRFEARYVAGQRIYVTRRRGVAVAFATFHDGSRDRTLDLLRLGEGAPDGTMHALVAAAISAAARDGIPRLSLAAAPVPRAEASWREPVAAGLAALSGDGLARFKAAFAPRWEPLYLAAPGRLALLGGALAAAHAIRRPPPFRTPGGTAAARVAAGAWPESAAGAATMGGTPLARSGAAAAEVPVHRAAGAGNGRGQRSTTAERFVADALEDRREAEARTRGGSGQGSGRAA